MFFHKVLLVIVIILLATHLTENYNQTIEIIYFTNSNCSATEKTDALLKGIEYGFDTKLDVKEVKIKLYGDDTESAEAKELREKYDIKGVPTIIINGKKFSKAFTKHNLEEAICENFIIKPRQCV